jgi:membrane protein implicated in regulation of membrane protease activity
MSPMWIWLILGFIAAGVEAFTLDLTFLLIAVGAISAAGVAALGGPIWLQGIVGIGVSLAGIFFVRPIAIRHLRRLPRSARTGVDALPGTTGRSLTEITVDGGQMQLRGEVWTARLDPDITHDMVLPGQPLVVTRIDGATALVHPIDE